MQELIQQATAKYGDSFSYVKVSDTLGAMQTIICKKHGDFRQRMETHLKSARCVECKKENAEQIMRTTSDFVKRAVLVHGPDRYDYNRVLYSTKKAKVEIICRVPGHSSFWQVPEIHVNGSGCPVCSGKARLDTAEFIRRSRESHPGEEYDYSRVIFTKTSEKVIIGCARHGFFPQFAAHHLRGVGCPQCHKSGSVARTTEEFIRLARITHQHDLYDYTNTTYKSAAGSVSIRCKLHGEFTPNATNFLIGSRCPGCGNLSRKAKHTLNTTKFIERANVVHTNEEYDYSAVKYVDCFTEIKIKHIKCGRIFTQSPTSHLSGSGCTNCKHKTESKLLEWLNIEFDPSNVESQVTFEECKKESTGRCYRYDFRVGDSIVEIDGLQHFTTIDLFKNCPEESLVNDTHKAWCITLSPKGPNLNLIRIYQPWVAADSNSWQEQLLRAIISLEHVRGQVVYIGGDIYDRHRDAYDKFIAQHAAGQAD